MNWNACFSSLIHGIVHVVPFECNFVDVDVRMIFSLVCLGFLGVWMLVDRLPPCEGRYFGGEDDVVMVA